MRNERKYKILSLLTVLLSVLLLGNCAREYWRMETAVYRHQEEWVLKGARVYAQNCVQCHGPRGEGIIGMPLNRKIYQVDYTTPAGKDYYNMIYQAIELGRPGNSDHFQWEKTPDGRWISYSAMPAWGKSVGGPLDEDYLKALTLFIMKPGGEQWYLVGTGSADEWDPSTAPYAPSNYTVGEDGLLPLPDSQVSPEVNAAGKALLRNIAKTTCLSCHTLGGRGTPIGPDLSRVGAWGVDQAFLEQWIKYAAPNPAATDPADRDAVPHDKRMPVYWSANRANIGPELNLKDAIISEGPYQMPRFKDRLTDQEIAIIAEYLMGLK